MGLAEIIKWWKAHRPTARRLAQLYAALLYNAHLKGFIDGKLYTGGAKALCVSGLNCYSCPGAVGACPLGSLQNALAASGHVAGWYVFGILLLLGVTLGRTICGWLCPVGLIQELLHKIPSPKLRKSRVTRALSVVKYVVLAVFVIALPLIYGLYHNMPLPAFCKYICPAGTAEGAISLLANPANEGMFAQLGALFTRKFVILIALALAGVFVYRVFCRFICPLGAIYSLFNRFALVGVRVDAAKCNGCGACVRHCPMDIRRVGDRECISCGKCVSYCAQGAISLKAGRATLAGPEKKRAGASRAAWGVFTAALVAAVVYFNVIAAPQGSATSPAAPAALETAAVTPSPEATPEPVKADESDAPVGHEVGQKLEDFTCVTTEGETFTLSDYRGKVVIINQWATYCTPCVGELPYFEQLAQAHDDVVILVFHHWLEATPDAKTYIDEKGWSGWKVLFTVDTQDENILSKIGGDNTMPRTVVLNGRGEVVYNEQRSVTYEMLESLLEMARE